MNVLFRPGSSRLCDQGRANPAAWRVNPYAKGMETAMAHRHTFSVHSRKSSRIVQALCLSAALMIPVSMVSELQFATAAHAKGGNGGGNGGGNSNGGSSNDHGGGNGSAKSGGGSGQGKGASSGSGRSKKATEETAVPTTATKPARRPVDPTLAEVLGVPPSELGALNAAKASPQALANAAPNSRVGKIGAYRNAVLAGRALEAEHEAEAAELAGMEEPARSVAEIDADLDQATTDLTAAEEERAALEAQLEAAGGSDAGIEAQIAEVDAEIEATGTEIDSLEAERTTTAEYEETAAEVAELETRLVEQPTVERDLLVAAANKPVTDAVATTVNALLGLE